MAEHFQQANVKLLTTLAFFKNRKRSMAEHFQTSQREASPPLACF